MTDDAPMPTTPGCLADYGWGPAVAARLPGVAEPAVARVVRTDRGAVLTATRDGLVHLPVPVAFGEQPVSGDWLVLAGDPPVPARLVPRQGSLVRRDASSTQVLAANVDEVLVMCGLDRELAAGTLDRALVLAWDSGARPAVLLAKADLVPEPDAAVAAVEALHPGVEVLAVSALAGTGLEGVRERLRPGRTLALLGESGTGKSTLVNALAGRDVQATRDVRPRDRQGRHTTRARHLVPMGAGAVVLDTPGVRTFGIVRAEAGLARAFADIGQHAGRCRFNDCGHRSEPQCAVLAAVASGDLAAERLRRYQRLAAEVRAPPRRGGGRPRRTAGARSRPRVPPSGFEPPLPP